MKRLIQFIIAYRRWLIVASVLLAAACTLWFSQVKIGSSYAGVFPPVGDPERTFLDKVDEDFGGDNVAIIAITHDHIFSPATLDKIHELTVAIEDLPAVEHVMSLTNATIMKSKRDEMYVWNISDDMPLSRSSLEEFRQDILSNPLYEDNLISDDERTTAMYVTIDRNVPDAVSRNTILAIGELARNAQGPEEIYVDGMAALSTAMFQMIVADLTTYLPLTLIIIVVILLVIFRSVYVVMLSVISITLAIIGTFGVMAMVRIPIFNFTATLPPILAALGISYFIHLFSAYFKQRSTAYSEKITVERALKRIMLAIWLSALTTAIGFASLMLVNIEVIKRMGAFLVIGVLFLLIYLSFLISPLLVCACPKPPHKRMFSSPVVRRMFERALAFCIRHRIAIAVLTAAAVIASVMGAGRLQVKSDVLHGYFRRSAPIRKATAIIASRLHGTALISIIIEGPAEGSAEDPAFLRSIEKLQSVVGRDPTVGKTISVVDYVKSVNKAMHDNDPDHYVLPATRSEIAQYLLAYSLADKQRTLDQYIDYERKVARVLVRSSLTSSDDLIDFKEYLEYICETVFPPEVAVRVTSEAILTSIAAQSISWGILLSVGLAALAIFIVMVVLFRSFKIGVVAMIPNLLPLAFMLGLMGWAGIDFNPGTGIVICVAIGIAVDDTIHFLVRYLYELRRTNHYLIRRLTGVRITAGQRQAIAATMNRVGRPIVLTSIAIFLGFLVLVLSQFVPIAYFGLLTAITMIFCLICDLIILPILLASIRI